MTAAKGKAPANVTEEAPIVAFKLSANPAREDGGSSFTWLSIDRKLCNVLQAVVATNALAASLLAVFLHRQRHSAIRATSSAGRGDRHVRACHAVTSDESSAGSY